MTWTTALVILAWIPAVAFLPLYHYYSRGSWARSLAGRDSMGLTAVIAASLGWAVARRLGADPDHPMVGVLFVLIAWAMWSHLVVLIRVQRHPSRHPRRRKDDL